MNEVIRRIWGTDYKTDREVIVQLMEDKHDLKIKLNAAEENLARAIKTAKSLIGMRDPELARNFESHIDFVK